MPIRVNADDGRMTREVFFAEFQAKRCLLYTSGPTQIANQLWVDKVLTPTAYKLSHGLSTNSPAPEDPYRWDKRAVSSILERLEYTGCTVNFKTYTNSIWDKKRHLNPVENQAIFPDTHERIIDDDVFEKVQEIRSQRHRMTRTGKSSIFSGMRCV